jgi:hypothetical protein
LNDQWNSIISSENLNAKVGLMTSDEGKYFVTLNDLNISSLDSIEKWKLSPAVFPSFHLSPINSRVNDQEISKF